MSELERACWRLLARGLSDDEIFEELRRLGFRRPRDVGGVEDSLWRVYKKLGLAESPSPVNNKRAAAAARYYQEDQYVNLSSEKLGGITNALQQGKVTSGLKLLEDWYLTTVEAAMVARRLARSSKPDRIADTVRQVVKGSERRPGRYFERVRRACRLWDR